MLGPLAHAVHRKYVIKVFCGVTLVGRVKGERRIPSLLVAAECVLPNLHTAARLVWHQLDDEQQAKSQPQYKVA